MLVCIVSLIKMQFLLVTMEEKVTKIADKQAKSRATKDIIEFALKLNTRKQFLALLCVLTDPRLIKQAFDCGYFWKGDKRIHAALELLNNQNIMLNFFLKVVQTVEE